MKIKISYNTVFKSSCVTKDLVYRSGLHHIRLESKSGLYLRAMGMNQTICRIHGCGKLPPAINRFTRQDDKFSPNQSPMSRSSLFIRLQTKGHRQAIYLPDCPVKWQRIYNLRTCSMTTFIKIRLRIHWAKSTALAKL